MFFSWVETLCIPWPHSRIFQCPSIHEGHFCIFLQEPLTFVHVNENEKGTCKTMKQRNFFTLLLSLAFVFSLLAGCASADSGASPSAPTASFAATSDQSSPATEEQGITVTDMMGRDITLSGPVTRVVAVSPADCEIIYALNGGSAVVGRGEYCDWPEAVLDVDAVESGMNLNVEQIIALAPDAVFLSSMSHGPETIAQIEEAGIPVIVSEAFTIAEVYESIALIGTCIGKETEAGQLVADMMDGFDAVQKAIGDASAENSIYFEVSPLEYGLWAAGSGSFMDEIASMLGLENIFSDLDAWAEVSQEQVIERNPGTIVTISMYYGDGPLPEEEISARPGWETISAVQNGRVFNADKDQLSRPGPRLVEGAHQLSVFVYGQAGDENQTAA